MNINPFFPPNVPTGAKDGGLIECPICGNTTGFLGPVQEPDGDTIKVQLACKQGHHYDLSLYETADTKGTLAWTVEYTFLQPPPVRKDKGE